MGEQVNVLFLYCCMDETGLGKPKVDKTAVDEMAVDEPGPDPKDIVRNFVNLIIQKLLPIFRKVLKTQVH